MKKNLGVNIKQQVDKNKGITIIALIITILLSYDEIRKYSNSNEFLLPINC